MKKNILHEKETSTRETEEQIVLSDINHLILNFDFNPSGYCVPHCLDDPSQINSTIQKLDKYSLILKLKGLFNDLSKIYPQLICLVEKCKKWDTDIQDEIRSIIEAIDKELLENQQRDVKKVRLDRGRALLRNIFNASPTLKSSLKEEFYEYEVSDKNVEDFSNIYAHSFKQIMDWNFLGNIGKNNKLLN